jgi:decaprenylphospho-beta-D-erythro-pentofuranosid-2-ulose 2-reductase
MSGLAAPAAGRLPADEPAGAPAAARAAAAGDRARARAGARARRVIVLGGTSEIACAIVDQLAREGTCEVVLVGRDEGALRDRAERLERAGAVSARPLAGLDAEDPSSHRGLIEQALSLLGGADLVILAVGLLGERGGLPEDVARALDVLRVNALGCASLAMEAARALREQGGGTLVVLSSFAAERPRRANAVYSASKAALDGLGQALADALGPSGVRIMVVRPGFVRTRMTAGLPEPPLACSPEVVARATVRGLERGAQTVWAPATLRWVGIALRLLPRRLFRRLSL